MSILIKREVLEFAQLISTFLIYFVNIEAYEKITAYCLSEAGSGSDALGAKCNAKLSEDGTEYVLNGEKMWISNGGFADVYIVFAKVDGASIL